MSYKIKRDELFEFYFHKQKDNGIIEHHINLKSTIGEGYFKDVPIVDGLNLYIVNMKIHRDLNVLGGFDKEFLMFSSIYEGSVNYEDKILQKKFNFKKGQTNLSYAKYEEGEEYYKTGQEFKYVTVFCNNDFVQRNNTLNKIFNKDKKREHFRFNGFNSNSHMVAKEIFDNPYEGDFEKFYLENKTMDLIFYGLNEYINENKKIKSSFLNEEDIIRIKIAKDILLQNYMNPPSICELSKKVAVNEFKLKKGFKLVYNETIYGYLLDFRMKKAYQLIQDDIYSLGEVSKLIGYKCQSSFTVAFIKKFGILPKSLMKIRKYY